MQSLLVELADVTVIDDPLERAVAADKLLWAASRRCYRQARELRRLALVQAVQGGRTRQEIATRLRVRESDLERLTAAESDAAEISGALPAST